MSASDEMSNSSLEEDIPAFVPSGPSKLWLFCSCRGSPPNSNCHLRHGPHYTSNLTTCPVAHPLYAVGASTGGNRRDKIVVAESEGHSEDHVGFL